MCFLHVQWVNMYTGKSGHQQRCVERLQPPQSRVRRLHQLCFNQSAIKLFTMLFTYYKSHITYNIYIYIHINHHIPIKHGNPPLETDFLWTINFSLLARCWFLSLKNLKPLKRGAFEWQMALSLLQMFAWQVEQWVQQSVEEFLVMYLTYIVDQCFQTWNFDQLIDSLCARVKWIILAMTAWYRHVLQEAGAVHVLKQAVIQNWPDEWLRLSQQVENSVCIARHRSAVVILGCSHTKNPSEMLSYRDTAAYMVIVHKWVRFVSLNWLMFIASNCGECDVRHRC